MRKLFFALLTVLTLAACSSDPVYHGMTTEQKEAYGKAVAGKYEGTYVIIYNNDSSDDKKAKIENAQMTITDQTTHSVLFHDFPVSLLSKVVTDPALADALVSAPNVDVMGDYRFYDLQDNGDVHWGFELATIPLTLHYGGVDHHLLLKPSTSVYLGLTKADLDGGTPFANQRVFEIDVVGIYEGDTLLQALDGWKSNNAFLTYFQLDRQSMQTIR